MILRKRLDRIEGKRLGFVPCGLAIIRRDAETGEALCALVPGAARQWRRDDETEADFMERIGGAA